MVWYEIKKVNDEYIVFKNLQTEHAFGCYGLFKGTRPACVKYCKEHNIEVKK